MKKILIFLLVVFPLFLASTSEYEVGCQDCFSGVHSAVMTEWATAGVEGVPQGTVPNRTNIFTTLSPGTNQIQSAINAANAAGGGVVLLLNGTHVITQDIVHRSNVVVRGESRAGTIIETQMRATGSQFHNAAWRMGVFNGWGNDAAHAATLASCVNAGIENLTFYYRYDSFDPIDDLDPPPGGLNFANVSTNDPYGVTNLRKDWIEIWGRNNWIKDVDILESGSDPLNVYGNHNTIKNVFINRSYNKGGGSNGYVAIRGDYNLFMDSFVGRVRHLVLEGYTDNNPRNQAAYNVLYNIETYDVDLNFHENDEGYNLAERLKIETTSYHHLKGLPIITGNPGQHDAPGPNNFLYNLDTSEAGILPASPQGIGPDCGIYNYGGVAGIVYTLTGVNTLDNCVVTPETLVDTGTAEPPCGTFVPNINSTTETGGGSNIITNPIELFLKLFYG